MIQLCCECDWGLGAVLPPHIHTELTLVRIPNNHRSIWVNHYLPTNGYDVLMSVEELRFHIDWKALYRPQTPKTWEQQ